MVVEYTVAYYPATYVEFGDRGIIVSPFYNETINSFQTAQLHFAPISPLYSCRIARRNVNFDFLLY